MNKVKKNVIIVGFPEEEKNSIALPYIEMGKIYYVDSISEATKHQGYLLIINNKDNQDIVDLDKKYRKSFARYERIWIYHEKYHWQKNKWSRIEKVNRDIFLDVSYSLTEEYDEYRKCTTKEEKRKSFHKSKEKDLMSFYRYLRNFKTLPTKQIANDLKMNYRSIERYMNTLNSIYHNIGYDYSKNEWYFIW